MDEKNVELNKEVLDNSEVENKTEEEVKPTEPEQKPVEETKEETPAEEEQEKKPSKLLQLFKVTKVFKKKLFGFILITTLTVIGGLLLFLLDDENQLRNAMGIKDSDVAWLRHIFNINVSIITWLIFFLIAGGAFFVFFIWFFKQPIKNKVEKSRKKKTGHGFTEKGNKIFEIVFWSIVAFLAIAAIITALSLFGVAGFGGFGMRFEGYGNGGFFVALGTFLWSAIVLLFTILSVPLLLLLFYLVYRLIILLFGGIGAGVAKTVMASPNFQETYAAAQAASNRINEEANQLPKTIAVNENQAAALAAAGGAGSAGGASSKLGQSSYEGILFPALDVIDQKYKKEEQPVEEAAEGEQPVEPQPRKKQDLSILIDEFQSYMASVEKLYFDKNVLRTFIAGMAASRLLLLEGLSGTGKSTLPRQFMKFTGGKSTFLQVQATWRDRTDIIGYFSDLTGYYKETELLKSIYESSYTPEQVNLIVLDEMNISRAEYYFADFLSIYEYPSELWKIQLMQTSSEMQLPNLIDRGALQIPTNIWFIGTINIDDSTFTVTDKVYDRAIVIDFNTINEPFEATYKARLEPFTHNDLAEFFKECQANPKLRLTKEDQHNIYELLAFLYETFDIKIGNRIFNQIELFVPVFVGLGGSKLDALDMMISAKIFRKLDLVFIMDMADSLIKLQRFLNAHFKKGSLPKCEAKINALLRKYQ